MRLFVAVNFPPETVDAISALQVRLRGAEPRGNWSRRENLHLTLAFLGEQPRERLDAAREAMDAALFRPLTLVFDRLGRFRRGEGDIWWLGAAHNPALEAAQRRLARELAARGFALEERRFVPHLTLARRVPPAGAEPPGLEFAPVEAPAGRISLMLSERPGGKLTYTELYSC